MQLTKQKYILHINKQFEYPIRIKIFLIGEVDGADGIASIQNSDYRI